MSKFTIDALTGREHLFIGEFGGVTGDTNLIFSNGLTKSNNNVRLGGLLDQDTIITDTRSNKVGIVYDSDYSEDFVDRSLVDKGFVLSELDGYTPITLFTQFQNETEEVIEELEDDLNTFSGNTLQTISDILDDVDFIGTYGTYAVTTGLISGGTLTITDGDNTKFDIIPFYGLFVDKHTDPKNPVVIEHYFDGVTGITPDFLTTRQATYIAIDINNNIIQSDNPITTEEKRDYIVLGSVIHNDLSIINDVNISPTTTTNIGELTRDGFRTIGLIRADEGNTLQPCVNDLEFCKTQGRLFKFSGGYGANKKDPNFIDVPETAPTEFYYRTFEGVSSGLLTELITDEWEEVDEFGNSTIHQITGSELQATVQRVLLFQSGKVVIQRGQAVYNTLQQAVNTFLLEDFKYEKNVLVDALQIGAIAITVNCKNLDNPSRAAFVPTDPYGSLLGGGNTGCFDLFNTVNVRNITDFPDPDENGVITLNGNFTYVINGSVDIGDNKFDINGSVIFRGRNPTIDIISGNTSESIFIGEDNTVLFDYVGLINTNPDGNLFSLSGNPNTYFIMQNSTILENTNIGEFHKYNFVYLKNVIFDDMLDGIYFYGGDDEFSRASVFVDTIYILEQSASGQTMFNVVDGYFSTIKFWDNNVRIGSGNYFLGVDHDKVNVLDNTLKDGIVIDNEFVLSDGAEVLSGITKRTSGWFVFGNRGIENSVIQGFIEFIDNDETTQINSTNEYYKAQGQNTGNTQGERMDVSVNNRILYVCPCRPIFSGDINVTGSVRVEGNNQSVLVGLFKNGAELIAIGSFFLPRSGEPDIFSIITIDEVSVDDYYEIFVRNLTSINNITIEYMQFKIIGFA